MDGDGEFTEYVAAWWPRLVRSAILLGCSPTEAEDVVQTALTRCLVHWPKVERATDRDAYVARVLINTFIDARRRRWRDERPTHLVPDQVTGDETEGVVTTDLLARSLASLPEDQRAAVMLRHYLHMSEQQMVTVLGVAPGTVKSRLSRALRALSADPTLAEYGANRRGAR